MGRIHERGIGAACPHRQRSEHVCAGSRALLGLIFGLGGRLDGLGRAVSHNSWTKMTSSRAVAVTVVLPLVSVALILVTPGYLPRIVAVLAAAVTLARVGSSMVHVTVPLPVVVAVIAALFTPPTQTRTSLVESVMVGASGGASSLASWRSARALPTRSLKN